MQGFLSNVKCFVYQTTLNSELLKIILKITLYVEIKNIIQQNWKIQQSHKTNQMKIVQMTITFIYSSEAEFINVFKKGSLLHYKRLIWFCRVFCDKFNKCHKNLKKLQWTRILSSNKCKLVCFSVFKTLAKCKNYVNSSFIKQEIKNICTSVKCWI